MACRAIEPSPQSKPGIKNLDSEGAVAINNVTLPQCQIPENRLGPGNTTSYSQSSSPSPVTRSGLGHAPSPPVTGSGPHQAPSPLCGAGLEPGCILQSPQSQIGSHHKHPRCRIGIISQIRNDQPLPVQPISQIKLSTSAFNTLASSVNITIGQVMNYLLTTLPCSIMASRTQRTDAVALYNTSYSWNISTLTGMAVGKGHFVPGTRNTGSPVWVICPLVS